MQLLNFEIARTRAFLRIVALGLLLTGAGDIARADGAKRFWSFGDSFTDVSNSGPRGSNYPSKHETESEFNITIRYRISCTMSLTRHVATQRFQATGQSAATVLKAMARGWLNEQVEAALKDLGEESLDPKDVVMINMGINDADGFTGSSSNVTEIAESAALLRRWNASLRRAPGTSSSWRSAL